MHDNGATTAGPGVTNEPTTGESGGSPLGGGALSTATASTVSGGSPDATPVPAQGRLVIEGPGQIGLNESAEIEIRITGPALPVAAFNFDIVYDQRILTLEAPAPALDGLNVGNREWQCSIPPASGDVDPNPSLGRARLVCFSQGGQNAPAPRVPLLLARVSLRGVSHGETILRIEQAAAYGPDARSLGIAASETTIRAE